MSVAAGKPAENAPPEGAHGPAQGAGAQGEDARALERLARAIAPRSLLDLGFEIPWNHRLSTKLFAMIGAVAFGVVAAFFFAEVAVQRHLLSQVVAESDLLSHTISNALHRAMLQDRRGDAYLIMQDIGRQPGIEKVRMMDAEGLITFSTERVRDRAQRWTAPRRPAPGATQRTSRSTALELRERSRIFANGDHRVLGIITPIYNEPSCSTAACHAHPPEQKVLGVLDVGVSLSRLDEETAGFRWRTLFAAASAAALLGSFVWLFTRHHLIRPVAALVQATRRGRARPARARDPGHVERRARAPRRVLQRDDALAPRGEGGARRAHARPRARGGGADGGAARRAGSARAEREALVARQALRVDRPRDQQPARRHPHVLEAHRADPRAGGAGRRDAARARASTSCSSSARPSAAPPSCGTSSTSPASARSR